MTHSMKLHREPFDMIKSGKKDIELRLYDEKRRGISVGDEIEFTRSGGEEKMLCRVVALHIFESFAELCFAAAIPRAIFPPPHPMI